MDYIVLIFIYFLLFFLIGTLQKNNSIVDIGWGPGFVIVIWYSSWRDSSVVPGQVIQTLFVTIWGLRLFYHIIKRNIGRDEDFRYIAFRRAWGKWVVPRAFLQIYMLQGFLLYLISLSFIYTAKQGIEATPLLLVPGILIWLIGFFFEAVGDYQLQLFLSNQDNKGKLMTSGVWSLTRHPNYFGEAAMWWGIYLIAVVSGAPIWTILSPVVITLLLLYVSGVPLLENSMKRKPGFKEYAHRTNKFFPWFPRKKR